MSTKTYGHVSKEQLLDILELSKKEQITERAASERILGYTHLGLSKYKTKYGIAKNFDYRNYTRKHKINDNFFEEINPKTAYWAGFIAADGNISKSNNALTITLVDSDSEQLERFLKDTAADYQVTHFERSGNAFCTIHIVSQKMADDLNNNYNIVPAKSLILKAPNIDWEDKESIDAYIIGLIDGDGTIGFQKTKRTQPRFYISIIGTTEVLSFVKARFEEILQRDTSNLFYDQKRYSSNTCTIRIGDLAARELFTHFYKQPIRKMCRKWSDEKYEYCQNFKKALPVCRRKGVKIFNLQGEFVKEVETLSEAEKFTGASSGTISKLCKLDDNKHMSKGYMFSRTKLEMKPYEPSTALNTKYMEKFVNSINTTVENIEDNA